MPSLPLLQTLVRELVSTGHSPRVPEPDLVMDDPAKVAAFIRAGQEDSTMASVYVFHSIHVSEVIRPGDTVVDLGCGPANQLGMIARLNPQTRFIGIDLSDEMLERARAHIDRLGLKNVEFRKDDITKLASVADRSVDAVFSTVVLHQLPDVEHMFATLAEVNRILKDDGGLYLVDFAHLKSERSIRYFAYQHEDRQPELFTEDYLNSLRAAFYLDEFKRAKAMHLQGRGELYTMFPLRFMMAIKSRRRNPSTAAQAQALGRQIETLPVPQRQDLKDLITLFGLGGMRTPPLK